MWILEALKKSPPVVGISIVALGILFIPLSAKILVVSGPVGTSREELREAGSLLAAGALSVEALQSRGLTVKSREGYLLTADLSPNGTGPTYIWSDGPVTMGPGFKSPSGTMYENSNPGSPRKVAPGQQPLLRMATALTSASFTSGRLVLGYNVSGPGAVSVQALGPNGRILGSWRWVEGQAGSQSRSLDLGKNSLRGSPVWIRWTHGRSQAVRKLVLSSSP